MFISLNRLGSMVLDFDGNTLSAIFLDDLGAVADSFTIKKCDSGLILTNQEVISTVAYETCASITASDGFHILASGNVTFRAGSQVILGSGFSVRTGATFKIEIDAALAAESE